MEKRIVIGTRGSDLALWQARFLQEELKRVNRESELKIIKTKGDKIQHISLEKLEGKGFFTKEIEDALLNGEIDVAVHSHKDLPTEPTPGLIIAAVSYREDPSELLLIRKECVDLRKEFQLKENAVVGTSSSRRRVQLKIFRPDLEIKDIRGNVPGRIEKLRSGAYDAILLAAAGVQRLKLDISDLHSLHLPLHKLIPAPAQGVLAYQCREGDELITSLLQSIHHKDVAEQIFVEREVMRLFKGGCHMPLGVYCKKDHGEFHIWAAQSHASENELKRLYLKTKTVEGAAEQIFFTLQKSDSRSVFFSTTSAGSDLFVELLQRRGFHVTAKSLLNIQPLKIDELPEADFLFFTSKTGVQHFFEQVQPKGNIKIAAIGEETAREIQNHGYLVDFTGEGESEEIASAFIASHPSLTVLMPQALNSNNKLSEHLQQHLNVIHLPVYVNQPLQDLQLGYHDILVFTSALNADAYCRNNKILSQQIVIAIGETTKNHLHQLGVQDVIMPPFKNFISIADLICGLT